MVTTDNEQKPTAGTKAGGIVPSDAKALKEAYIAGSSIAALAVEYGYSESEVQATVVKPVEGDS